MIMTMKIVATIVLCCIPRTFGKESTASAGVTLIPVILLTAAILTNPCLMVKLHTQKRGEVWKCLVSPDDFDGKANHKLDIVGLEEHDTTRVVSGSTYMLAEGSTILGHAIDVKQVDVTFRTTEDKTRNSKRFGTSTALAVRVVSNDGANPFSLNELADNVFTDDVNLSERFASCSYNKMNIVPFSGNLNGVTIDDGMYEAFIDANTNGMDEDRLDELVTDQLNNDLGDDFVNSVDHIMIFAPDNIPDFGANAEYPGQWSMYDGFEASFSSVTLVHEIGHNLFLDHSSEGDDEYGDGKCSSLFEIHSLIPSCRKQTLARWALEATWMIFEPASILPRAGFLGGIRTNTYH